MRRKTVNIPRIAGRLMLISVYLLFFMVQFINRSGVICSAVPTTVQQSQYSDIQTGHQKIYGKPDSLKQTNLRINKRFYPEAVIALRFNYTPSLISFQAPFNPPARKDYLLISSIITDSLRGPPAIAA